jgi:NAD-dependent deacetylase
MTPPRQPGAAPRPDGPQGLATLIAESRSVVALTGAGISVPSGIPDFRSPQTGLWAQVDPMQVAHIDVFRRDPKRFWDFYGERFQALGPMRPNPAHAALVALERAGHLDGVITQNIDRLHEAAGTRELVEVHGSIGHCACPVCGSRYPLAEVQRRRAADPDGIPRCDCEAPLKPEVVLFGEMLPAQAWARAEQLAVGADLMICIGSSLEVYPVAGLPELTLASGGSIAIVTRSTTALDPLATVRLGGDVAQELSAVVAALGLSSQTAAG